MTLTPEFTGADALLWTAADADVDVCFANPGTTEMPLVAALARQRAIRPILCLSEGVCSGAADGYGRIAGKPAMTGFRKHLIFNSPTKPFAPVKRPNGPRRDGL